MKSKRMFIKTFMKIRSCLILVTMQKIKICFDRINKKVIGKLKDEVKGEIVSEFVGLNSKIYFQSLM